MENKESTADRLTPRKFMSDAALNFAAQHKIENKEVVSALEEEFLKIFRAITIQSYIDCAKFAKLEQNKFYGTPQLALTFIHDKLMDTARIISEDF